MPKQSIDYSTGKIYKIISSTSNYVYVGSTTTTLSTRLSNHKNHYKTGYSNALALLFNNNNIDNCYIELIKNYPSSCRNELEREEGIELRKINNDTSTKEICLNYNIAGRTQKEYYQDHKEKIMEISKQWYENNKEQIAEKYTCECGGKYTQYNKSRHEKTEKHQSFINSQTTEQTL
tara:strand:- start:88 stop:618 length:531 start_codon:yes stop_codon:yes gene_type:complete